MEQLIKTNETTTNLKPHFFSLYSNSYDCTPIKPIDIEGTLLLIKEDEVLQDLTDYVRGANDEKERDKRKQQSLSLVTFSALCDYRSTHPRQDKEESRGKQGVLCHSGLICVDIDDVDDIDGLREEIMDNADENFHVVLMFVSPSGHGLKVVHPTERITGDIEHIKAKHLQWFEYYRDYYQQNFRVAIDEACKDVVRACYLCHDDQAYAQEWNSWMDPLPEVHIPSAENAENAETSDYPNNVNNIETANSAFSATVYVKPSNEEMQKNAKKLMFKTWDVRATEAHVCDNYDNYFPFVSACANGTGIYGKEYCREICQRSLKYDEQNFEMLYEQQMNNAQNTYGFGTAVLLCDSATATQTRKSMGIEQQWDMENLPLWIPKGENLTETICYTMGTITSLSAVMPHVVFNHDNRDYNLNLYTIIQGELASGKSKAIDMTHCLDDIDGYMQTLTDENTNSKKLPYCVKECGNITDAMLIYDLAHNQTNPNKGSMLISIPEIDVMSQSKKVGLSTENTRMAWGHEEISCKRKGMDKKSREEDRKGYKITHPRVSLLLTGTPSQMPHYFTNNCDGNLSRYLVYTLPENRQYRSGLTPQKEEVQIDYSNILRAWGNQYNSRITTKFLYTSSQAEVFDKTWEDIKAYFAANNDKFYNYVNRMPVAARRIAGVLTTMRYWERGEVTPQEMYPTDQDWQMGIQLVLNSIDALYHLYNHPSISHKDVMKRQVWADMLQRIPTKFKTNQFLDLAISEGYSDRSAAKGLVFLRQNNYIKQTAHGHYEKVTQ